MKDIDRTGDIAQQLLENDILMEAFDIAEREAIEASLKSFTDKGRAYHLARVRAIRDVRGNLRSFITSARQSLRRAPSVV
jgi:hypothetical protein